MKVPAGYSTEAVTVIGFSPAISLTPAAQLTQTSRTVFSPAPDWLFVAIRLLLSVSVPLEKP